MKPSAYTWILPFVFLNITHVNGQSDNFPGYKIKVKTQSGMFKGRLTGILDSSIEVTGNGNNNKRILPVATIQLIKVKRPFLKNVGVDIAVGAILGGGLVVAYYLKRNFYTPDDPPFGRALWTTMAFGASAGFMYGSIESTFVRIRIPIHKAQYMFENKRDKLNKYITY